MIDSPITFTAANRSAVPPPCTSEGAAPCEPGLLAGDKRIFCPVHDLWKYRRHAELCRLRNDYFQSYEDAGLLTKTSQELEELQRQAPVRIESQGPGAELLKMLRRPVKVLGAVFRVKLGCTGSCEAYAAEMDEWGVVGCRERLDEIVAHLESQAEQLKLPLKRRAARLFVKRAIRRAAKKQDPDGD